jgi:uncharacterized membrane protein
MTRAEFIATLRRGLAGMPAEAVDDIVADYEAHFDDALAAGRSEAEVAEALGDPERLAKDLRAAAPSGAWDEPRADRRDRRSFAGGRAFRRIGRMGPLGWVLVVLAVIGALTVLPIILTVVGAIVGVVLAVALVVVVIALIGAGLSGVVFRRSGRWSGFRGEFAAPIRAIGPPASRSFAWTGSDTLRISLPADVSFRQSTEVGLTIDGPADALDHVVVEGGDIRYDRWISNAGRLRIMLSAPAVTVFQIMGSANLTISEYRQDRLKIRIAGHGKAQAWGAARAANIGIAGKGDIDLGRLTGESVKVEIAGSGRATIAPTEIAEIGIAGSGLVTLLTTPPVLRTRFAGSGRVVHAASAA